MGTPEYKDVLRVEEVEGGLSVKLRRKQLGFERIIDGEEVKVKLGYMDSQGLLHYFNEGGGPGSEFWEPVYNGIKYDKGNIAIGASQSGRRLEVRDDTYSTSSYQIRTSYSNSVYADLGIDQYGEFNITSNNASHFKMADNYFDLASRNASLSYYSNQLLLQTTGPSSNVGLKTGDSGSVILEPSGNVAIGVPTAMKRLEVRDGATASTYYQIRTSYSDSAIADLGIDQSGSFRITPNNNARFSMGDNSLNFECKNAAMQYAGSELLLQATGIGNDIRLKSGQSGNILLEPGVGYIVSVGGSLKFNESGKNAYIHYNGITEQFLIPSDVSIEPYHKLSFGGRSDCAVYGDVDWNCNISGSKQVNILADFLKLPVKNTPGHPANPSDGCIYVNKSDKGIFLYIDTAWRTLLTW
jgi:hypothetical protein